MPTKAHKELDLTEPCTFTLQSSDAVFTPNVFRFLVEWFEFEPEKIEKALSESFNLPVPVAEAALMGTAKYKIDDTAGTVTITWEGMERTAMIGAVYKLQALASEQDELATFQLQEKALAILKEYLNLKGESEIIGALNKIDIHG